MSMMLFFGIAHYTFAQSYTSFFTGDKKDIITNSKGACVLMGGATENDNAMKWFLSHSDGGDVVVLRASGSDGYNTYIYSDLGVKVNSVETILFNSVLASYDPYVINQIRNAEALWIAGGDQWNYFSFWKGTPIDTAINYLINEKHVPVGGTSAGMAIMGSIINTAQNGGVTSEGALGDPYNDYVTISNAPFINEPHLKNVITDTHYDNPDRKGRHIAFIARAMKDYGVAAKGIACDEYTAICIEENGMARVFGDYPSKEDFAYFIQPNCAMPNEAEVCNSGQPLTWDRSQQAIKVYKVPGTASGQNTFDLNEWLKGSGGSWENWCITKGVLQINTSGSEPNCTPVSTNNLSGEDKLLKIYPSTTNDVVTVSTSQNINWHSLAIINGLGIEIHRVDNPNAVTQINVADWARGLYFVKLSDASSQSVGKFVKE